VQSVGEEIKKCNFFISSPTLSEGYFGGKSKIFLHRLITMVREVFLPPSRPSGDKIGGKRLLWSEFLFF
jgi:hypothetical protein